MGEPGAATARTVVGAAAVVAVVSVLVAAWWLSPGRQLHDPVTGLQQLDLLYLDEPAPLLDRLAIPPGEPAVLLVCDTCAEPEVDATVVRSTDPDVARAYALATADGGVGPGYALIDADGRVRYRTFDSDPAAHAAELRVLLGALG